MNRRDFLRFAGVGVALVRETSAVEGRDPVIHLLNRIAFGPRPGQVEAVRRTGIKTFIEQQLEPQTIPDHEVEKRLTGYETLKLSAFDLMKLQPDNGETVAELNSATVLRAVYSERQLYEIMVNFWSEHFSIWHGKDECKYLKTVDDREVIRKHALGNFRDLLGASAKSPAMLIYLDNATSTKRKPNENYARELMELHTTAVGSYTEQDVREIARAFTGWTITTLHDEFPDEFKFYPDWHDDEEKTALGQRLAAGGGIADGETLLDILAAHPATARHICSKLCRRFISDDPPESIIRSAAQTFIASKGNIRSVLRTIFESEAFLNAPPKFKRPFEYVISLCRALNVEIAPYDPTASNPNAISTGLLQALEAMGHLPFNHPTPEGYADSADWWLDNLLLRWNFAIDLVNGVFRDADIDFPGLLRSQSIELKPRPILEYFGQHLFGRVLTPTEREVIWQFVSRDGEPDMATQAGQSRLWDAIGLLAASPAVQFR